MVANLGGLEAELECLARTDRVIIHRSPLPEKQANRIGYYVCDYNNVVLFPRLRLAELGGATAQETHRWLWDHRPSFNS